MYSNLLYSNLRGSASDNRRLMNTVGKWGVPGRSHKRVYRWPGYAVYRFAVNRLRPLPVPAATVVRRQAEVNPEPGTVRFNPPPGWPLPPREWKPPADWEPDPLWAPAPPGWQLWVPDELAPLAEYNSCAIPQHVKIEVAERDEGRCRQCGSTAELRFDRVIPWSKGGANTPVNVQLLCGPCHRLKDTYEILAGM